MKYFENDAEAIAVLSSNLNLPDGDWAFVAAAPRVELEVWGLGVVIRDRAGYGEVLREQASGSKADMVEYAAWLNDFRGIDQAAADELVASSIKAQMQSSQIKDDIDSLIDYILEDAGAADDFHDMLKWAHDEPSDPDNKVTPYDLPEGEWRAKVAEYLGAPKFYPELDRGPEGQDLDKFNDLALHTTGHVYCAAMRLDAIRKGEE